MFFLFPSQVKERKFIIKGINIVLEKESNISKGFIIYKQYNYFNSRLARASKQLKVT